MHIHDMPELPADQVFFDSSLDSAMELARRIGPELINGFPFASGAADDGVLRGPPDAGPLPK